MKSFVVLLVALSIFSFMLVAPVYAEEQKQFQVTTKMNFPESIPAGKPVDFTIDVTYQGPYSWVQNLEPKFEIIPSRAHYDVDIQYDDSISDYTIWKGHIHTLHGTIHVSKDTAFDAIFLSVSFDGVVRSNDAVVSVDPDSTVSLSIDKSTQETTSTNQFHKGTIEWISRCFMVGSDVTLRITDPDMNRDSELVEEINVTIWSDNDDRKVAYTVTETGPDTGVFDENVFFTTTDSSPGKRLRIVDGSTVFAKYVDYTFSDSHKEIDVINSVTTSGLSVLERHVDGSVSKIIYDTCALVLFAQNPDKFEQMTVFYPTPLKQIGSGLLVDEVRCKESFSLIEKQDESPACVTEETKQKLLERRWTGTPSYEIVGLDKAYVGEPISLAVDILAWHSCHNNYDAKIYTTSYEPVWDYSSSGSCITIEPAKLQEYTIDVPRNKKYPIIETTGNYIFEIRFGHVVLAEEFFVKNLTFKPTQNTISVFCGPTLEQLQEMAPIDILTPKDMPLGYSLKSTDNVHDGIVLLNYARGNTCGPDAHSLNDGKIEIVIAFSSDAPLKSSGEQFIEQYKTKYRENNVSYYTDISDSGLYIIGTGGIKKEIVDENNRISEEIWIEPTRVHVFDENNAAGYKITAHLPIHDVMSMAGSLS